MISISGQLYPATADDTALYEQLVYLAKGRYELRQREGRWWSVTPMSASQGATWFPHRDFLGADVAAVVRIEALEA